MHGHINYSGMWGDIIPPDVYAAFGAGGKAIFASPSLNLVIAQQRNLRSITEKKSVARSKFALETF